MTNPTNAPLIPQSVDVPRSQIDINQLSVPGASCCCCQCHIIRSFISLLHRHTHALHPYVNYRPHRRRWQTDYSSHKLGNTFFPFHSTIMWLYTHTHTHTNTNTRWANFPIASVVTPQKWGNYVPNLPQDLICWYCITTTKATRHTAPLPTQACVYAFVPSKI